MSTTHAVSPFQNPHARSCHHTIALLPTAVHGFDVPGAGNWTNRGASSFRSPLVIWALAVTLNAVPMFMPPTWAVLAYFHLYHGLPVVPLAIVGAFGAATGRAVLALGSRAIGDRFIPESWRANIETLAAGLQSRPTLALPSLALFALGPVPSNQLFVAAGLARAPLPPLLLVFGVARCLSYVLWVSAADVADRSLRDIFGSRYVG